MDLKTIRSQSNRTPIKKFREPGNRKCTNYEYMENIFFRAR